MSGRPVHRLALFSSLIACVIATTLAVGSPVQAVDSWSLPEQLSDLSDGPAYEPQIAMSADGDTLAVTWVSNGDTIQVSTSTDSGDTWSAPVDLSDTADGPANYPQIAMSAGGQELAVTWFSNGDTIQVSTSIDSGNNWSTPDDLLVPGDPVDGAQIAMSADGDTLAVTWIRTTGSGYFVEVSRSTNSGATWSAPEPLSDPADGSANSARIAISADGDTLAVTWVQYLLSGDTIHVSKSTNSGATWSTPDDLSDTADGDASAPEIVSSADGQELAVTWTSDGLVDIVQVSTSPDSGATWSTPDDLSDTADGDANSPRIAGSTDGTTLAVTWVSDGDTIQASTSTDSGTTWSTPDDLSDTADGDAADPQIISSTDGTTLAVTWTRFDGTDQIVRVRTSPDSGATWSTPDDLSDTGGFAFYPQIASSTDGNALAVTWYWTDFVNFIAQVSKFASSDSGGDSSGGGVSRPAIRRVTLDPAGGVCGEHSTPWTIRQRQAVTLPTASDCTRDGYTLLGWTRDPANTAPENLLHTVIARSGTVTAVWGKLPNPPSAVFAIRDFLCNKCGSALVIWQTTDTDTTGFTVTIDDTPTACTPTNLGTWWLCGISGLTPNQPHTFGVSTQNTNGTSNTTKTTQ